MKHTYKLTQNLKISFIVIKHSNELFSKIIHITEKIENFWKHGAFIRLKDYLNLISIKVKYISKVVKIFMFKLG